VLLTARRVSDVMFFFPARRVPDMQWVELYVRFPTCRHFLTCKASVRYLDNQILDSEIPRRYLDSWNLDSQNRVRGTVTVRVRVSYDCPVYDCPDFDSAIKTCNHGTATCHFLAHVYCRQTAGWIKMPFVMDYGGTCRPRPHCVRWEPSSPIRGIAAP